MSEIKLFRTKTIDLEWVIPPGRDNAGTHGHHNQNSGPQTGSKRLHNELQKITDESLTLEEFNRRVTELAVEWKIKPGLPDLPSAR